jgi:hypothetical protein
MINTGIRARNVAGQNQFNADTVAAQNAKLSAKSQIAANVGNKAMQMRAEKGRKEYDASYLDVLRQKYKDSGINERMIEVWMKKYMDESKAKGTFKYGGKILRKKKS